MLDKELLLEFELCLIPQVNSYGELERRMNDIKKIFEVPYEKIKGGSPLLFLWTYFVKVVFKSLFRS